MNAIGSSPLSTYNTNMTTASNKNTLHSPEFKIHSRIQDAINSKKSFKDTHGGKNMDSDSDKSPEISVKKSIQKRQSTKFRSMDITKSALNRAASLNNEEPLIQNPKNQDELSKQEMLSDLKEASKEGNSISLSPPRSVVPEIKPNTGQKI